MTNWIPRSSNHDRCRSQGFSQQARSAAPTCLGKPASAASERVAPVLPATAESGRRLGRLGRRVARSANRGFLRNIGLSKVSVVLLRQALTVLPVAAVQNCYGLLDEVGRAGRRSKGPAGRGRGRTRRRPVSGRVGLAAQSRHQALGCRGQLQGSRAHHKLGLPQFRSSEAVENLVQLHGRARHASLDHPVQSAGQ